MKRRHLKWVSIILALLGALMRVVAYQLHQPGAQWELPFDMAATSHFMAAASFFFYCKVGSVERGIFRVLMFCELFECVKELAGNYSMKSTAEVWIFCGMVILVSIYSILAHYVHKSSRKSRA